MKHIKVYVCVSAKEKKLGGERKRLGLLSFFLSLSASKMTRVYYINGGFRGAREAQPVYYNAHVIRYRAQGSSKTP